MIDTDLGLSLKQLILHTMRNRYVGYGLLVSCLRYVPYEVDLCNTAAIHLPGTSLRHQIPRLRVP